MKANCYECTYRSNIPGDAHSCCKHPLLNLSEDPVGALIEFILCKTTDAETRLNIKGNQHGIEHGWFTWPINFDPVWLENCDGFKAKEVEEVK